jgi:hypothetical protein
VAGGEDESTPVVAGRSTPALGLFGFIRLASRLAVNRVPDMNRIDGPRLGAAGDWADWLSRSIISTAYGRNLGDLVPEASARLSQRGRRFTLVANAPTESRAADRQRTGRDTAHGAPKQN